MNNLIGQKFGKMLVVKGAPRGKASKARYICECECGRTKTCFATNLLRGLTTSCGCSRKKYEGSHPTSEHGAWSNMIQRCTNQKSGEYKNYGARGIKVCDRWLNSFIDFLNDMGRKPNPKLTLERINNNGNYEPENCKWATQSEQNYNKRQHKLTLEIATEILKLRKSGKLAKEIAEQFGIHSTLVYLIEHGKSWPHAQMALLKEQYSNENST